MATSTENSTIHSVRLSPAPLPLLPPQTDAPKNSYWYNKPEKRRSGENKEKEEKKKKEKREKQNMKNVRQQGKRTRGEDEARRRRDEEMEMRKRGEK